MAPARLIRAPFPISPPLWVPVFKDYQINHVPAMIAGKAFAIFPGPFIPTRDPPEGPPASAAFHQGFKKSAEWTKTQNPGRFFSARQMTGVFPSRSANVFDAI
jgi:hypothetical protein